MSLKHIVAPYVAPPMQPSDSGLQGLLADCRRTSPFTCGPAPTAETLPMRGGVVQMIQREILAAEARHQRNLRRAKRASLIEAELRALTTKILRGGA